MAICSIIRFVNANRKHTFSPAAVAAGSFLFLTIFALLTSPIKNITYAILFFIGLAVFLTSSGYFLTYLRKAAVGPKERYRIFIASLFILTALMFRSAQSLNWIDGLVLLLIIAGLLFYSGRRAD